MIVFLLKFVVLFVFLDIKLSRQFYQPKPRFVSCCFYLLWLSFLHLAKRKETITVIYNSWDSSVVLPVEKINHMEIRASASIYFCLLSHMQILSLVSRYIIVTCASIVITAHSFVQYIGCVRSSWIFLNMILPHGSRRLKRRELFQSKGKL